MTGPSPVAAAAGRAPPQRPRFEVADVVRAGGAELTGVLTGAQRQVLRALVRCRTAALGGHVEGCAGCGHRRIAYNSCRNRHCPKCQGKERARWLAVEQGLLLPTCYFHVVFTLPHQLNPLIRVNRRRLLALLFRTAAATLRAFALDRTHLGAEPAITMVLHTWGQTLTEHYHVHCVVSGGGLSPDRTRWVARTRHGRRHRRPFLFPVAALSQVFRGKYLAALQQTHQHHPLRFAGQSAELARPDAWQRLIERLYATPWVIYAKRPFGGPERVLKYLARYTHRVAIANQRIAFVGDGVVRFHYRDYPRGARPREMTLPIPEFLRRFLLHVLPPGFMRIRHYGITANATRQQKLSRCRILLGLPPSSTATDPLLPPARPAADTPPPTSSPPAARCPRCGGAMRVIEILPPPPYDTS